MKAGSLRVRVTSWYAGLLAVALAVFGAAVYFGLQGYLENSLQHSLSSQAAGLEQNFLSHAQSKGKAWLVGEVVESYAPESSGRFIRITHRGGPVLYESGDTRDPFIDASRVSHPAAAQESGAYRRESFDGVHRLLIYTQAYTSPEGGSYIVEIGASQSLIDHVLRSLLFTLLFLAPLILVAAAIGGYLLMTRPLRPVVALTAQAERIGTNELGERLPVIPTGDELERLSLALNRMISRLEDALAHNRRFSADVSHELRTPLTILRGELDHVAELPGLPPPVLEAVGSALEEIDRMSKIVDSLLAISRIDSGGAGLERARVDLCALLAATADQMRLLAEEKKIALLSTPSELIFVTGDVTRLKQILVNLLDNAIKYTGEGGHIAAQVSAIAGFAVLEIRDDGIGIPRASLPYVFDRFYRADKARSRESGGTGLGLAIVKAICTAHDGSVSIDSVEGSGAVVRVELPLSSADPHRSMDISHLRRLSGATRPAALQDETSGETVLQGPERNS